MQPIIVTTSCDNKKNAETISRLVLENRLAACVQISSPVKSMYWWKNEIVTEAEYILSMKSRRSLFQSLTELIKKNHSYEVPEIVATDLVEVYKPYRDWLSSQLC